MPKRIIDGESLWTSTKLKKVKSEFRLHYANWIPLAEANGVFEADIDIIWSRIYSFLLPETTITTVKNILEEFKRVGLIDTWKAEGKTWGYFIGIEKSGRLPALAHRDRYGELPPKYPKSEELIRINSGLTPDKLRNESVQDRFRIGKDRIGIEKPQNVFKKLVELSGSSEPKDFYKNELKSLVDRYDSERVIEAFEFWQKNSNYSGKYPIKSFCHVAENLINQEPTENINLELQETIDKIALKSDNAVVPSPSQVPILAKMVLDYGKDLVIQAFNEFYSRIDNDENAIKYALKNFLDKGPQFLRTLKIKQEEAQQQQIMIETWEAKARAESEKQRAIDEAAEKQEQEFWSTA